MEKVMKIKLGKRVADERNKVNYEGETRAKNCYRRHGEGIEC